MKKKINPFLETCLNPRNASLKKAYLVITVLLVAFTFQRCNNQDDQAPAKGNVTFSLRTVDGANGRKQAHELAGKSIELSVETASGVSVLLNHKIKLSIFGNSYSTEPLELAIGNYVITKFMVVDDSSRVHFATPLAGSPLAPLVEHSLPSNFNVTLNLVANVEMEVVPVDTHTPEEFGYASFHVNVVRPLSISVFTTHDNTIKLTGAQAFIISDDDTLHTYSLSDKVNLLSFKQDPLATYKLVIIKDGYARFNKTFVYNDLMAALNGIPLKVYLEPAVTMRGYYKNEVYAEPLTLFDLLSQNNATYIIDWGDGTIETRNTNIAEYDVTMEHVYPNKTAHYFITVTGDIENITGFDFFPHGLYYSNINLDNLPEMKSIKVVFGGLNVLDVRKNKKLETILFPGEVLLLPEVHHLSSVAICNEALAPSLDSIINSIYQNATTQVIMGGKFTYDDCFNEGGSTPPPLGTPSAESLQKLLNLQVEYNWTIQPALE